MTRERREREGERERYARRKRNAWKDGGHSPSAGKPTIYGSVATSVFTRRDALPPTTRKVRCEDTAMRNGKPHSWSFPAHILLIHGIGITRHQDASNILFTRTLSHSDKFPKMSLLCLLKCLIDVLSAYRERWSTTSTYIQYTISRLC